MIIPMDHLSIKRGLCWVLLACWTCWDVWYHLVELGGVERRSYNESWWFLYSIIEVHRVFIEFYYKVEFNNVKSFFRERSLQDCLAKNKLRNNQFIWIFQNLKSWKKVLQKEKSASWIILFCFVIRRIVRIRGEYLASIFKDFLNILGANFFSLKNFILKSKIFEIFILTKRIFERFLDYAASSGRK